jgi:hypothetical protein
MTTASGAADLAAVVRIRAYSLLAGVNVRQSA